MDEARIIEEKFEIWIQDEIVWYKYRKGAVIDLDTAKKVVETRLKITNGSTLPALIDAREGQYLMHEAKEFFTTEYATIQISAAAYLIKSDVQKIIINSYLSLLSSKFPMKVFTDLDKALQFLEEYKVLRTF